MSRLNASKAMTSVIALTCMTAAIGMSGSAASAQAGAAPSLKAGDFTADFSAMAKLKSLAEQGKGKIGVLLPETTTSARYTSFDAPYLKKAFEAAGLSPDQYIITNAQGSELTELTQAQSDISQGATVLLMDPISSGVGASIETYAKSHGVPVIDYDRLTLGGDREYYVSFNNVEVGKLIGQGMTECLADWAVKSPQILVMRGTDRQQRDPVRPRLRQRARPVVQLEEIHQGRRARRHLGSGGRPHDVRGAIHRPFQHQRGGDAERRHGQRRRLLSEDLKGPAQDLPDHRAGRNVDRTAECARGLPVRHGLQADLSRGAGVGGARSLPARRRKPPAGLVNGATMDSKQKKDVPSVLMTPLWVTPKNMAATAVKDGFVDAAKLCAGDLAAACKSADVAM